MHSPLAGIPIDRRRRLAASLGLFAVLFVAVGVVAATGSTPGIVRVFSAVALSVAVVLGAVAWGVTRSVTIDRAEGLLDAAIDEAMAAGGELGCGCGHDHDVDELHVSGQQHVDDKPGAHDGPCPVSGGECTHSCDACVLAALRPSPSRPRAERTPG